MSSTIGQQRTPFKLTNQASPDATPWASSCLNCGASLVGPFCSDCGQRAVPPSPTLNELAGDAIAEFRLEQFAEARPRAVVNRSRLLVAAEFDDQFRRRVVGHERLCYITKRDG